MDIFYHHVGKNGASEDFPKTVYSPVSFETIKYNFVGDPVEKTQLIDILESNFPNGKCNCWGVPSGAKAIIRNLKIGDYVLLVETTADQGNIPVLAEVKYFIDSEQRNLSLALWNNHKFPYVFFFETEKINLTWKDFSEDMGYKPNYNPRGQFLPVKKNRLQRFDQPEFYIEHLKKEYKIDSSKTKILERNPPSTQFNLTLPDALEDLKKYEPTFTNLSETEKEEIRKSRIGQGRFRRQLLEYWETCSVTNCKPHPLLRASHIKPWRNSSNDERLDKYNGLLLIPSLDALFDQGFISFDDDGKIIISPNLDIETIRILGVHEKLSINSSKIAAAHREYLNYHRSKIFKR